MSLIISFCLISIPCSENVLYRWILLNVLEASREVHDFSPSALVSRSVEGLPDEDRREWTPSLHAFRATKSPEQLYHPADDRRELAGTLSRPADFDSTIDQIQAQRCA